jgi:hypothetical protein
MRVDDTPSARRLKPMRESSEIVGSPAVPERQCDRDHLWISTGRNGSGVSQQLRNRVLDVQFFEKRCHEHRRPALSNNPGGEGSEYAAPLRCAPSGRHVVGSLCRFRWTNFRFGPHPRLIFAVISPHVPCRFAIAVAESTSVPQTRHRIWRELALLEAVRESITRAWAVDTPRSGPQPSLRGSCYPGSSAKLARGLGSNDSSLDDADIELCGQSNRTTAGLL